ncbi:MULTISPECIES: cellulose-binding protein [unclassified Plantactinospora]|uniref:cellulose-binding protein n=1 Tax=unclassified Plantactinospora TaxID=2631981 RepID=UPI000D1616E7|nr:MULTISPECIES: cellulose-binding protein [unclassified Plantactinospora]AVT32148.1 cellulose-binding protein [Plantactinospora sp. BC1]AVT40541.1 cellulose-binding protein [Plantactinospora sp. BB1]
MSAPEPTRPRLLAAAPWIVVLAGVLVMTVLFALAAGYLTGDRRTSGAPEPAWPFAPGSTPAPVDSGTDPASPSSSPSAAPRTPTPTSARPNGGKPAASRPAPPRTTPARPRPTTSAPKPPEPLTGRYRVLADYRDSFIAEVLVRNESGSAQSWTVELRFRHEVDDLRGFWVEGAPRPSVDRDDGRWIFRSGAPLAGGESDPLRFQFERWGDGERPISCTVNGRACQIP